MLTIIPTDTCYGLAWDFNEQDYQEIYRLKGRDFTKLLAWLVRDYEDLHKYIEITDEQIEFLQNYPRPWSILGKKREDFILPEFLDAKTYEKISLRVASACLPKSVFSGNPPPDKGELEGVTQKRILYSVTHPIPPFSGRGLGYPLFLTSANISGNPESKTLVEAREFFPWVEGIDGGICDEPPSDIFFFDEQGSVEYLRKYTNY